MSVLAQLVERCRRTGRLDVPADDDIDDAPTEDADAGITDDVDDELAPLPLDATLSLDEDDETGLSLDDEDARAVVDNLDDDDDDDDAPLDNDVGTASRLFLRGIIIELRSASTPRCLRQTRAPHSGSGRC